MFEISLTFCIWDTENKKRKEIEGLEGGECCVYELWPVLVLVRISSKIGWRTLQCWSRIGYSEIVFRTELHKTEVILIGKGY